MIKSYKISSSALVLVLSLYFGLVLNFGFWRFIADNLEISGWAGWVFLASLPFFIVVPLYLFFSLIVCPYIVKPLLTILLLLSSVANYAMFNLGVFIDSDMYRNIIETNSREAFDLITFSAVVWVLLSGILPLLPLWWAKIVFVPWKTELFLRFRNMLAAFLMLLCFVPVSYKEYVSFGRNNREVRKLINTFNYIYAVGRYYKRQSDATRKFVVLDDKASAEFPVNAPRRVLVLMIGETARAKNFSLYVYERETNPLLAKQDIVSFQDTSSCGTATAVSLPCMFSHFGRDNFDADDAKYTQNLVDLLQLAGYDVWWRENDDGCKGVCKRVASEDMVASRNPIHCEKDFCRDEVLLNGLFEKISELKKDTVIVLHMMGSHRPTYYKRYPERFKKFLPACDTADLQKCSREQIVNTYDNTILYTDFVISSAIDILKKFPQHETGLIYISDHGESLGENNIYLHGIPYAIAPQEQKKVPFLLWMSEKMKKSTSSDWKCLQRQARIAGYSQDNLFHSVLGLMKVKTSVYDAGLDIFSSCALSAK